MRTNAWLLVEGKQRCECVLTDISDSGAHVNVHDSEDNSRYFSAVAGGKRRHAAPVPGDMAQAAQVGVKFKKWLDERIRAGRAISPKPTKTDETAKSV